ncbi:hypothetical protein [Dechloromonas hortensis]|uniref:hypothetical protein n=1 Tax=Dechloromonas hortensis TaxID=337779 RepID=UPI00129099AD|nr:hypothetical protein [Dechloromonas hortensis]
MRRNLLFLLLVLLVPFSGQAQEALVIIAHGSLPKTDLATVQRLYTGRILSIADQPAVPINLPPGNPLRQQFLEAYLEQNEEQYTGYWLVRRYVGKGTPPREMASVEEILRFVGSTPGAVAYVPQSKVPKGANVVFKR